MENFTDMTINHPLDANKIAQTIFKYGFAIVPNYFGESDLEAIRQDHANAMDFSPSITNKVDFGNGEMTQFKRYVMERYKDMFGNILKSFHSDFSIEVTKIFFKKYGIEIADEDISAQFEIEYDSEYGKSNGSDIHYDRVPSMKMCLYLDDTTKENGALRVVPKSHIVTRNIALSQYLKNNNPLYQKNFLKEDSLVNYHYIEAKAGSVVFLDTFCLHGGGYIKGKNSTRKVIRAINWAAPLLSSYLTSQKENEMKHVFKEEDFFHPRPVPDNQVIEDKLLFRLFKEIYE